MQAESARFVLDLNIDMAPSQSGNERCLYASPAVPSGRRRTTDNRSVARVEVTLGRMPVSEGLRIVSETTSRKMRAELESGRQLPAGTGKQKLVAEFTDRFDCGWANLESAFVDDGPRRTLVLVWHANLRAGLIPSPTLVKFSKSKHAIAQAANLKLATASYYRNYEGTQSGIRDEMEARQVVDLVTVIGDSRSPFPSSSIMSPSGKATYATDRTWLFCTAVKPAGDTDLERMRQQYSAESATVISDPSSFASDLGRVFAGNPPLTRLGGRDELKLGYYRRHRIDNVVQVFHGPVLYTDDQELAFSQPSHLRGIASCFFKGPAFEWQREYRFVVSTVGEPAEDQLYLPVSDPSLAGCLVFYLVRGIRVEGVSTTFGVWRRWWG